LQLRDSCGTERAAPAVFPVNVEGAALAAQGDCKYRHSLKECLRMKCKLAVHAYEENHQICWNVVKILQFESSIRFWKREKSRAGGVFGK